MPPFPGEDRLLTLFADVHYYFTVPTPNPIYHRFDKGSYLYVYYDAVRGSARLEIANNPGSNDLDSFNGALDNVHLVHSTRFPTLCTVTVGAQVENSPVSAHSSGGGQDQWLLPFTDFRDQSKRNLRLHTLDIYFWTLDDANQFLDAVERVIAPQQVESDRYAHSQAEEEPAVSTVVEQLENVAITDPAYQNGQTKDSRPDPSMAGEGASTKEQPTNSSPATPAAPEPTPAASEEAPKEETTDYTPLAYNPAAPAAPEFIKHREKTPPPEDAKEGTGLAMAAAADQSQQYPLSQPTTSSFSQPPSYSAPGNYNNASSLSAVFPPTPTQPGPPVYTAVASPPPTTQAGGMSFAPPPQNPNAHLFAQDSYDSEKLQSAQQQAQAPQNPNAHLFSQNSYDSQQSYTSPQQHPQLQHQHQQQHHHNSHHPQYADYLQSHGHASFEDKRVAIGGYANYSYAQQHRNQYGITNEYDIHNQVYRPTESEASKHSSSHSPKRGTVVEKGLGRVDSKVNSIFKKIEKRLG